MSTRSGKNTAEERAEAIEAERLARKADAAARRYKLEVIRKEREADERAAQAEREADQANLETPPNSAAADQAGPANPFDPVQEEAAVPQPVPAAMSFEDTNGEDAADLYQKAGAIKLAYNKDNVKLWFGQLETKMRFLGIKLQFLKLPSALRQTSTRNY